MRLIFKPCEAVVNTVAIDAGDHFDHVLQVVHSFQLFDFEHSAELGFFDAHVFVGAVEVTFVAQDEEGDLSALQTWVSRHLVENFLVNVDAVLIRGVYNVENSINLRVEVLPLFSVSTLS